MVKTNVRLTAPGAAQHPLAQRFEAIRTRLGVVADFPAEALREAEAAAQTWSRDGRADRTELPFVTLDPVGSSNGPARASGCAMRSPTCRPSSLPAARST